MLLNGGSLKENGDYVVIHGGLLSKASCLYCT